VHGNNQCLKWQNLTYISSLDFQGATLVHVLKVNRKASNRQFITVGMRVSFLLLSHIYNIILAAGICRSLKLVLSEPPTQRRRDQRLVQTAHSRISLLHEQIIRRQAGRVIRTSKCLCVLLEGCWSYIWVLQAEAKSTGKTKQLSHTQTVRNSAGRQITSRPFKTSLPASVAPGSSRLLICGIIFEKPILLVDKLRLLLAVPHSLFLQPTKEFNCFILRVSLEMNQRKVCTL